MAHNPERQPHVRTGFANKSNDIDYAAEVEAFLASLHSQLTPADRIRQRRTEAIEKLDRFGLVSSEDMKEVKGDLEQALGFECKILRVIRAVIGSADGSERLVTRVIAGGYQQLTEEVVDPSLGVIDVEDGRANALSDKARAKIWQMCANQNAPVYVPAGAASYFEGDIHEALVAVGRDQGMAVRDVYRSEGPAVSGVRSLQ